MQRVGPQAPRETGPEPYAPKRAIRGFGYCYRRGRVWWVRYSHRGRDHRESAHSERETDAWRLLKGRWKQIGRGRFVFGEDKVRMAERFDGLELDYQNNGRRSVRGFGGVWRLSGPRSARTAPST